MITTYSGINIQKGLLADQCLENIDQLESQESIYSVLPVRQKPVFVDTFAFPSQKIMLRLLALFSGKTGRSPEKYLTRDKELNSDDENQRVSDFINSVLQEAIVNETYGEDNELILETEQTAIVSNNPYVDGTARIPGDLFSDDLIQREEKLALYIKKTFGAEGLRHFLGLVIGLDVHGRDGIYRFTINEHLERLGYQRSKKGSFDPALKWKALRIIEVLSSLHMTISSKKGTREKMSCIRLFSLERYDIEREIEFNEPIHMNFILRASDNWYGQAFQKTDARSQQYTQLLKKIATENHREHPLAISLTPQLAIQWRMNKFQPLRLRESTIMDMCDLDHTTANSKRMRDLRKVEDEFDYMAEVGYLGSWQNSNQSLEGEKPFARVLELHAPDWLGKSMKQKVRPTTKTASTMTVDGLKWLQQQAGLNQSELAEVLGVSRQHINNISNGRSRISKKFSEKITDHFGELLEDVSTKPCPLGLETLPS